VACDGDDHWLIFSLDSILLENLSDLSGGLISVQEWHVAVHQNQFVQMEVPLPNGILDCLDSLLSIIGECGYLLSVHNAKHEHETVNDVTIGFFVINNQDLELWVVGDLIYLRHSNGWYTYEVIDCDV
jgi:hypothetical protein